MGKNIIVAAITGNNGKKQHGTVGNFRKEKDVVMVDFTGPKNNSETVSFEKLHFPNYKARNAAEALRIGVIAEFIPED